MYNNNIWEQAEAWVDGAWRVVDATTLAPRSSLVRIATGRDAQGNVQCFFNTCRHRGSALKSEDGFGDRRIDRARAGGRLLHPRHELRDSGGVAGVTAAEQHVAQDQAERVFRHGMFPIAGHVGDLDPPRPASVQVDVVEAGGTGGDEAQLRKLRDDLAGEARVHENRYGLEILPLRGEIRIQLVRA